MVRRLSIAIVAVALVAVNTGCVERRFRIESNPPGAYVYVNNKSYGTTPVDVPFLFYGDYEIELQKEGYQTLKIKQPVKPPWYEYPVVDFFSENLVPLKITDQRPFCYDLEPVLVPNLEILKAQGEELRMRASGLPKPRYPDSRKDTPIDEPRKKKDVPPTTPPPTLAPTPGEILPLPKDKPSGSPPPPAKPPELE